jgi:hypothetical protein
LTNPEAKKYLAGFQGSRLHIASANRTNSGLPKKCEMGPQENILKDSNGLSIRQNNPQQ